MTFIKTSETFGVWPVMRANTAYGLGFGSEANLAKFIAKFQERKEVARLAAHKAGNNGVAVRLAAEEPRSAQGAGDLHSSSHMRHAAAVASLPQTTAEAQLRYENDILKRALAQSSAYTKTFEEEESNIAAKEWKRQLHVLKEENAAMRARILDFEASGVGAGGAPDVSVVTERHLELAPLRASVDLLRRENKQKYGELEDLKQKLKDQMFKKAHNALMSYNKMLN
ncbi:hypothetical protein HPB48_004795 [Haemaphysalis longicornis]|uniref:WH1 domain-containing protein n=1 Tax=Haemaphysalis longicornis TaxID=44386 RepID=A0A9J6FCZ3_HAELO|nr:hypothetical protein HPB48_004795 [Haemaphysalis longicornis]